MCVSSYARMQHPPAIPGHLPSTPCACGWPPPHTPATQLPNTQTVFGGLRDIVTGPYATGAIFTNIGPDTVGVAHGRTLKMIDPSGMVVPNKNVSEIFDEHAMKAAKGRCARFLRMRACGCGCGCMHMRA